MKTVDPIQHEIEQWYARTGVAVTVRCRYFTGGGRTDGRTDSKDWWYGDTEFLSIGPLGSIDEVLAALERKLK